MEDGAVQSKEALLKVLQEARERIAQLESRLAGSSDSHDSPEKCRLHSLLEEIPSVAVQSYASDGTTLFWNVASEELYGYSKNEALGRNLLELIIPPPMHEQVAQNIRGMAETGEPIPSGELVLRHKDGSPVPVFSSHALVRVPGSPPELFCMDIDLRERKAMEESLRKTAARLEEAQRIARASDWEWDPQRDVVTWSRQLYDILDLPPDQPPPNYEGQLALYHPEDAPRLHEAVTQCLEQGTPYELELRRIRPDGEVLTLLVRGLRETDETGRMKRLYGSMQDVSSYKRVERELLEAKAAAEEASQAKSAFLANMSHEIRTPLNGVMGMLHLLQTTNLDSEQSDYARNAEQACRRLTHLLGDILDLSQVESGKLTIQCEPFDLHELLHQVQELFLPVARQSGVQLRLHVSPDMPRNLCGDATRLQQVLLNLVGNALKFTPSGSVEIEAHPLAGHDDACCRVLFSVKDSGIGIAEDKLQMLFKPFFQISQGLTRQFQGAGLGLAICKRLVTLMGGNLAVESQEGEGTAFHFCIAFRKNGRSVPSRRKRPSPCELKPLKLRVLLVEDDDLSRDIAARFLKALSCSVATAGDGRQALAMLRRGDFDLVLMDLQLPLMNGLEALAAIRQGAAGMSKAAIPVVAMTAYCMSEDKAAFTAQGLDGYLCKPLMLEELHSALVQAAQPRPS